MARRFTGLLPSVALAGAGIAFAALGLRALRLEEHDDARKAVEEAQQALGTAERLLPGELFSPSRTPDDRYPLDARVPPTAALRAAPPEARLLFDEATYAERRGDRDEAYRILSRLAERSDVGILSRLARSRAGAYAARTGDVAATGRLVAPLVSAWEETDENGVGLAELALRDLSVTDLGQGRAGSALTLVHANGRERYRWEPGVDWGDLVIAVADQASRSPTIGAVARRAIEDAADRARRAHRTIDDLRQRIASQKALPIAVDGPHLAVLAPDRSAVLLFRQDRVGQDLSRGAEAAVTVRDRPWLAPDTVEAPVARTGNAIWLSVEVPRPPARTAARWALGAGLAAYAAGGAFLVHALRRSTRAARMQSDFVAAVSHEMKTPIAGVQAMAEMLAEGRVTDPAKAHDYAERIRGEMGRLGATVRDVLDVSRIERDPGALVHPRPLDPATVVDDVLEVARPALVRRGIALSASVTPSPAPLPVDPDALAHVLHNLLDNAAKFGGEGREVEVRAGPEGPGYRIEVLDRGPGVPMEDRERVFERFFRGEHARRQAVPGVGLGLHVAREIVRAHGGSIAATDRAGGGARFVVDLPGGRA